MEDLESKKAKVRQAYSQFSSAPEPKRLSAETAPQGPLPQFDLMRKRVQQRSQAEGQTQQDAMRRRLAAAGTLNAGAGIKALQVAQESQARATEDAVQGVEAQEAQARAGLEESARGRNLAREQFNESMAFQDRMARADNFAKFQGLESQLDSLDMQRIQLKLQQEESAFNQRLAKWQAANTGGLFGGGGFLGLGLGTPDFEG